MVARSLWTPGQLGYGLLLPHFGPAATRERLLDGARLAERSGIDAVFVRDHIAFRPRVVESGDRDYLDAFVVLSAVGAVTERLVLGTAVLIPHRHPILTALMLASLERVAGAGRVLPVWGLGGIDREFDAVGMSGWDRRELLSENVDILRKLWTGEAVDYEGRYYRFKDVDIHPTPTGGSIPMWYGGTSVAAVRRAVEIFNGWSAGNMPARDYMRFRRKLEEFAERAGRPVPPTSLTPFISPGRTVEEASSRVPVARLSPEFVEHKYMPPWPDGYRTVEDFDGAVLAGPPDVIAEGVRRHQANGVQLVIFDLRLRADDWENCLAIVCQDVLPLLQRSAD